MSSQPLISVCIPCYNGAEFIAQTLESVLHQSFTDFEVVIADDHSTDETVSIIKGFADPRIRLVQNQSNLGLGRNWDQVLSLGVGKYVKLLCEDDLLHPECLARQVRVLQSLSQSGVVLALCNRNVINRQNEVILGRRRILRSGVINGAKLIRKCLRWGSNLIGEPAVGLFPRDAMKKGAMCDPANPYLSDLDLWAELLREGDAFIDAESLASFRISAGSASATIGYRQAAYFRAFARKMRRDRFYRAGLGDVMSGYVLSFQWCLLRNAFIELHSRRGFRNNHAGAAASRIDESHSTELDKISGPSNRSSLKLSVRMPNGT